MRKLRRAVASRSASQVRRRGGGWAHLHPSAEVAASACRPRRAAGRRQPVLPGTGDVLVVAARRGRMPGNVVSWWVSVDGATFLEETCILNVCGVWRSGRWWGSLRRCLAASSSMSCRHRSSSDDKCSRLARGEVGRVRAACRPGIGHDLA